MAAKVVFDAETRKWFDRHPDAQTTVCQCPRCCLFYKPSLGHKCKAEPLTTARYGSSRGNTKSTLSAERIKEKLEGGGSDEA